MSYYGEAAMLGKVDPNGLLRLRRVVQKLNGLSVSTIYGKDIWDAGSVRRLKALVE